MLECYCVADPCCSCFGYVNAVALVVFHRCAQAITHVCSCIPRVPVVGLDVGLNGASKWGKRLLHVVVMAVDIANAEIFGVTFDVCSKFKVSSAGSSRWHHNERGNLSSTPASIDMKCALNV